jgi:hypothetical protein
MNKLVVILLSIIVFYSCSDREDPIGKWDDNIKLSTKNVVFSANADSVFITAEGDWWWIDCISFNDSCYCYSQREDINLELESYIIKEEFFVVERRNKNTLFVKMDENLTGTERLMSIVLQAGNYFDYVQIKQLAE